MTRAYIIFRDIQEHYFTLILERCLSLQAAQSVADFLETKSAAKIIAYGFVQEFAYKGKAAQETGYYDRVAQQLKLIFRRDDGEILDFLIPAPLDSLIDADQEATPEILADAQALLQSSINSTLQPLSGGLVAHYPVRLPFDDK